VTLEGFPEGELGEADLKKFLTGKKIVGNAIQYGKQEYYFLASGQMVMYSNSRRGLAQGVWEVFESKRTKGRWGFRLDVVGDWQYDGGQTVRLKAPGGVFWSQQSEWFTF
jgi:hypothetical protein